MKILMIGQKGVPARSGGVERHVDELATRLASAGHEVVVYCRTSYVTDAHQMHYGAVQLVYLPTIHSKHLETIIHTFLASLHALFQRADIIHYHGIGPSLFVWIPRIFAPRVKIISTFHCQDYFHQKWGFLAQLVFRVGEYFACRFTHVTIVVSQLLRDYVKNTYDRDALYIPNAVALSEYRKPERIQALGLSQNGYILSVSRLIPHKGIHVIIEAYRRLAHLRADLPPLVIVGAASFTERYVAHLKELAGADPRILFLGEKDADTLAELYSNARLFVQASQTEGLSYTLLEAMSYGCPVLVSDIAENREVMPSRDMAFRTGDVHDLAQKMEQSLAVVPQSEQRTYVRDHVSRNYNIEAVIPAILQVYDSSVGQGIA